MKALLLSMMVLWGACLSFSAMADDGYGPREFELIQKGEGIEIGPFWVPSLERYYGLRRSVDAGNKILMDGTIRFEPEDAVESIEICNAPPEEGQCEADPESCWDCSGDGILECGQPCVTRHFFDWFDPCVEPGLIGYFLYNSDENASNSDELIIMGQIEMPDVGQDCSADPIQPESSNCSWNPNPQMSLGALMLLFGALCLRRKQPV